MDAQQNEPKIITTLDERETLKNQMVAIREAGKFEAAIQGFQRILEWDNSNGNTAGEFDVLGHLRIAYTNWAGASDNLETKKEKLEQASQVQTRIIEFASQHFPGDKNRQALVSAHYVDLLIDQATLSQEMGKATEPYISQGTWALDFAFENLGGSEAHKAWLWRKKAQLAILSGDLEAALESINKGEKAISDGYEQESKNPDGLMKIRVWKSGLWITLSEIYIIQGKLELAKINLAAIIAIKDPSGTLNTRKDQARRMLEKIG